MRARVVLGGGAAVLLTPLILFVAGGDPWPRHVAAPQGAAHVAAARPSTPGSRGASPTSSSSGLQVRLAVAGDTGTGDDAQRSVADRMASRAGGHPYDALLLLGDLVYETGDAARTDAVVKEPFKAVLAGGAELIPVLGNHDYLEGEQQQILEALGRSTPWYTAQVGPVRVVVLDSDLIDEPAQTRWLQQTLAAKVPAGTWTIVSMHHPAYSSGQHGSTASVQEKWVPLFTRYRVPLVLAGHDHDYERVKPQHGVTYVVSGGGAKLRAVGRSDFTAVSSSTLHYLDISVYPHRVTVSAIAATGSTLDAFSLHR